MLTAFVLAPKRAPAEEIDWSLTMGWVIGAFVVVLFVIIPFVAWRLIAASDRKRKAQIEAERLAMQRQQEEAWRFQQAQEQERRRAEAEWRKQEAERARTLAIAQRDREAALARAEQEREAERTTARAREAQVREAARRRRLELLAARFGPENAAKIMTGQFWVGQTAEMLVESLGRPADVEERVLKTKTKHVYKYQPTGANRYALRITLDDGVVVGWDQK